MLKPKRWHKVSIGTEFRFHFSRFSPIYKKLWEREYQCISDGEIYNHESPGIVYLESADERETCPVL